MLKPLKPAFFLTLLVFAFLALSAGVIFAATYTSTDVPKAIPDAISDPETEISIPQSVTSTLTVPDSGTITDVNLSISLTHTFMGDLSVTLTSPGGTTIVLVNQTCGSKDNMNVTVDDEAPAGNLLQNCTPTGPGSEAYVTGESYRPRDPLSSFDGEDAAGTWTLTIYDNAFLDTGTLNGWSLDLTAGTAPTITSAASGSGTVGTAFSHTFTATGDPTPTFSYSDENLPPGVTRTDDTLSGTPTTPGNYSIFAVASNGIEPGATQTFTITINGIAPTITSAASASGAVGTAFNHTFTATGNPAPILSYSDENLPPGVTRTGDTLSGTPTAPGNYSITATASNDVEPDAVQTFTITVTGDAPVITSAPSTTGTVGAPLTFTFTATGNPAPTLSYSAENLPPGVTRTGDVLSGTPTTAGSYGLTVTAANGVESDAVQNFTITISGDAPVITSAATLNVPFNTAFSHTFTATGNPTPTLSYSDVNLPPGVALSGDTLAGSSTTPGVYTVTATATNGVTPDAVQVFTLTIGESQVLAPPPTPLCEEHNFDENGIVRSSTADAYGYAVNCRVLYQNGSPTSWLGGDLYNGGSIGIEGIFDLGVQQAVDIFSPSGMTYFNGGAVFCLKGSGYLIWSAASGAPRVPQIIGSYQVPEFPGFTCATLFEPGTLVLVTQNPVR